MKAKNKKSVPLGTQICVQENDIPPREKTQAERLFERIGTGAGHAIRRPGDAKTDRALRRLIAEANKQGDCIINNGEGYYRAGAEDRAEFELYLQKEMHRIRESKLKVIRMSVAYNRRFR